MVASMVIYTGALSAVNLRGDAHSEQSRRTGQSAPVEQAEHADEEGMRKEAAASAGDYVPTFFDGQGGVAGVQLTEEQRQAVIKMAVARGMSEREAHELAYGSDDKERHDNGGAYIWAAGTPLRHLSPVEEAAHKTTPAVGTGRDNGAGPNPSTTSKGADSNLKEQKGKPAKGEAAATGKAKKGKPEEKAKQGVTDMLKESLREAVPDPVEDVFEVLRLKPFVSFLAEISEPGTEPAFEVHEIDTDGDSEAEAVRITASTQVSQTVMMTTNVVAPLESSPEAPASTIAVTLTDLATNEVIVAPDSKAVADSVDVSQAAIGEIVDAVTEAGRGEDLPALQDAEITATDAPRDTQP